MTTQQKQYGSPGDYEKKLPRIMERLGATEFDWNWDRHGCWVTFRYKGELYRFDHSLEKARAHDVNLRYGSDAFAQVVLALEDLARITERGIYDLQTWVAGLKFLPPPAVVPWHLKALGFDRIPADVAEVRERWRQLARQHHPDVGGDADQFTKLTQAAEEAARFMEARRSP